MPFTKSQRRRRRVRRALIADQKSQTNETLSIPPLETLKLPDSGSPPEVPNVAVDLDVDPDE